MNKKKSLRKSIKWALIFVGLFLLACSPRDNQDIPKEISVSYYFGCSSISSAENEEEKQVEIDVDGVKYFGIAPFQWYYRTTISTKETHIKVNVNSRRSTSLVYEVRKNMKYDERGNMVAPGVYAAGGTFYDELDKIITVQ